MHPSSPQTLRETRLAGADFVRAAACLLVLVYHLVQRLSPSVWTSDLRPTLVFGSMGSFGVSAFFVLSGYLLSRPFWLSYASGETMPSLRIFALRRAARILPGYWLSLTVTFLLGVTVFDLALTSDVLLRYFAGLLLVNGFHYTTMFPVEFNGPLWSIAFEVACYALLPLGFALVFLAQRRTNHPWIGLLLWLAIVEVSILMHHLIASYWPIGEDLRGWAYGLVGGAKLWMPRFNPIGFFSIFAIGSIAAGLQVRLGKHRHWCFDALAAMGLGLAAYSMWYFAYRGSEGYGLLEVPYGFPLFPLAIACVLVGAPSSHAIGTVLDNPALRYVAQISFGIYVWHYLVIELVREGWADNFVVGGIEDYGEWALLSAVVTVISLLLAHVSHRALELPAIAWARQFERRKASLPANVATANA